MIDSRKELENDKLDLQHYIGQDKALREKKEEEQKKLENEKLGKDDRIKKLDQQISIIKSDIDKHKDTLSNLTSNQEFLLSLSSQEFLENRDADML